MIKYIIVLMLLLTPNFTVYAADQTCTSCTASEIQTKLNACVSTGGGTVTIPSCNTLWDNGQAVMVYSNVPLKILGSGRMNTVITYSDGANPPTTISNNGHAGYGLMFEVHGSGLTELGNFTLRGNPHVTTASASAGNNGLLYIHASEGMEDLYVHDMGLYNGRGSHIYVCENLNSTLVFSRMYIGIAHEGAINTTLTGNVTIYQAGYGSAATIPVVNPDALPDVTNSTFFMTAYPNITLYCSGKDGNNLTGCYKIGYPTSYNLVSGALIYYQGSGPYGIRLHGTNDESSWEATPTIGSDNGVFVEDSYFKGTYHPIAGHGSVRTVVRHNDFSYITAGMEGHGPSYSFGCGQSGPTGSCYQGTFRYEVYDNYYHAPCGYANYVRSGYWYITGNTYDNCGAAPLHLEIENASQGTNCDVAHGCPWKYTGVAGKPAACSLASCVCQYNIDGTTQEDCWQSPKDFYMWGNTFTNSGYCTDEGSCITITDDGSGCIRSGGTASYNHNDYEYYLRAPSIAKGDPVGDWVEYTYPHPLSEGVPPPITPSQTGINFGGGASGGGGRIN